MERRQFNAGRCIFTIDRKDNVIIVNKGTQIFVGIIKNTLNNNAKISAWCESSNRMQTFHLDDSIPYYEMTDKKVEEIVKSIVATTRG